MRMLKTIVGVWLVLGIGCTMSKGAPTSTPVFREASRGVLFRLEVEGKNYLITAGHVCRDEDSMLVQGIYTKVILSVDQKNDLCVIEDDVKISLKTLRPAQSFVKGEKVVMHSYRVDKETNKLSYIGVSGSVFGFKEGQILPIQVVCDVICLSLRYIPEGILTDIRPIPGDSGSPVLNKEGRVVGILTHGVGSDTLITPIQPVIDFIRGKTLKEVEKQIMIQKSKKMGDIFCANQQKKGLKPNIGFLGYFNINIFCLED